MMVDFGLLVVLMGGLYLMGCKEVLFHEEVLRLIDGHGLEFLLRL
jgi:hypothetical protein